VLGPKLFRTSSFRLTALYAALFGASVLILFAVIYFATAGYIARQLDRAIDAELSVLEAEARIGGAAQVARIIAERQAETLRSGTVYLLEDAKGERIAGNISLRRPVVGWFSLHGRRRAAEGEKPHSIRARGARLDDGSYLAVGQDASQLEDLEALIIGAFGWSLAATLVLAILGGMVMSGVLRRIRATTRTTNAIMQGELSQRLQQRGVGDEFDQLAEAVNTMLARIETLVEGLKQISNDIAHDLRTPLSRLQQRLERARLATTTLGDDETLIDTSIEEMDAILDLFSAMLRIADIEATTRQSGFSRIDLSELLRTVVDVYEPAAAEKSQRIECAVPPNAMVRGDRELLTPLFANLGGECHQAQPAGQPHRRRSAACARRCRSGHRRHRPGHSRH